jgi:hypothetical protein
LVSFGGGGEDLFAVASVVAAGGFSGTYFAFGAQIWFGVALNVKVGFFFPLSAN